MKKKYYTFKNHFRDLKFYSNIICILATLQMQQQQYFIFWRSTGPGANQPTFCFYSIFN